VDVEVEAVLDHLGVRHHIASDRSGQIRLSNIVPSIENIALCANMERHVITDFEFLE
jgi:hypothetical protein